ncbi:hypothetical protein U7230_07560 [Carboxydochorda subterranea]|uniref:WYL domain-containing protein n=1 Tax=Carboxydichorda subterranea TaxID=3109565 RepID=A0ABZ1C4E1_9FIRM|nr:hypothetical protein [Limnochorda sp. L945t]WRP18838.1 hypothetical protein U7230_07560 [Limnochorda sp. L945t]
MELFDPTPTREVAVRLYADEVKPTTGPAGDCPWLYIGMLAIPEELHGHALGALEEARRKVGYERELHFTHLTQYPKIQLAKAWVQLVLGDARKCFHFHLLGIDLSKLRKEAFGDSRRERERRIYNRFFRSTTAYVLKGFFLSDPRVHGVRVTGVFHDRSEMEHDDLFDWHLMWRLGQDEPGIVFESERIHFIDSDHTKEQVFPSESHFIQLVDILLGATRECLDYTSEKPGPIEVATAFAPLLERLTDPKRAFNPNSRYRYYHRCSVSFFPSKELALSELNTLERARSRIYIERPLRMIHGRSGQQSLPLGE